MNTYQKSVKHATSNFGRRANGEVSLQFRLAFQLIHTREGKSSSPHFLDIHFLLRLINKTRRQTSEPGSQESKSVPQGHEGDAEEESEAELIFVTNITNYICGEKIVM